MKYLLGFLIILFIGIGIYTVYSSAVTTAEQTKTGAMTPAYEVGEQRQKYLTTLDIAYLRDLRIESPAPVIEEQLTDGPNYKRYIASYTSAGNKIYGLLTVPNLAMPEGGFSAIVFNHGYIPPEQYVTTERYIPYVDSLAKNGFVVFKIDLRGHGESEGKPYGSYFSNGYTVDALSALKSLQKLNYVNREKIGMWGHSMAGNLVLRAMLVSNEVKAGVIWSGAVYSYADFAKYRLNDTSYVRPMPEQDDSQRYENNFELEKEVGRLRDPNEQIDFSIPFWRGISLTQNISYLQHPIALHHAVNDSVVNVGYATDLEQALKENNKEYELFTYAGGGHNIDSPYFDQAMQRTIDFFKKHL